MELLQLQPEIERYREEGLAVLVASPDSPEIMASVLEEYGLEVTVLDDREDQLRQKFRVQGFPTGFLFDRDGNLAWATVSWDREKSLDRWTKKVEEVLAGQP